MIGTDETDADRMVTTNQDQQKVAKVRKDCAEECNLPVVSIIESSGVV